MENLFEFRKICQYCKATKISTKQSKCLDCQTKLAKHLNNTKPKVNILDYFYKKSGGILIPDDFKMFLDRH